MEFDFDVFTPVMPPSKAILKDDYETEWEGEDGITVTVRLGCGETIEWTEIGGTYEVFAGPVTLKMQEETFSLLFLPVDERKLPGNKKYCSYDTFMCDIERGQSYLIHDFEHDLVLSTVANVVEGNYVLQPLAFTDPKKKVSMAYKKVQYKLEEYGVGWAALRDRYGGEY